MKRCVILSVILILGISAFLRAEKVATITEVLKPTALYIDDDYIYITEGTTIHIYNRKDYKYIKKFGEKGEGPEEFMLFVVIQPQKDHLLINSLGKISYFTKLGKFKKEIKAKGGRNNLIFYPVEGGFVGRSSKTEDKTSYETVNLYDKDLKKIKEIYRMESDRQIQGRRKFYWPVRNLQYQAANNRIYVSGEPGFVVRVFNGDGTPLFTIEEKNYEKRKFTEEDKQRHLGFFKAQLKGQFDQFKQFLEYKSHFPEIAAVFVDNDALFVLTWKFEDGKFEIYQYDLDGKFVRKAYAPLRMSGPMQLYPAGIKNGLLYQLIENEDEDWDLHITELIK